MRKRRKRNEGKKERQKDEEKKIIKRTTSRTPYIKHTQQMTYLMTMGYFRANSTM